MNDLYSNFAFLNSKDTVLESRKICFFSKGVSPWYFVKNLKFFYPFF